VLILIGTSVVGVTIVRRLQTISQSEVTAIRGELVRIHSTAGDEVKSMDVEDGVLFLHLETTAGVVIMGYDLSTGQVVSKVVFDQEP
jgi:hypothetical protein